LRFSADEGREEAVSREDFGQGFQQENCKVKKVFQPRAGVIGALFPIGQYAFHDGAFALNTWVDARTFQTPGRRPSTLEKVTELPVFALGEG
jgi:hypothetical protein